jgi:hypothetical protein
MRIIRNNVGIIVMTLIFVVLLLVVVRAMNSKTVPDQLGGDTATYSPPAAPATAVTTIPAANPGSSAAPSPVDSAPPSLAELPVNTALTGSAAIAWADAALAALGAPTTSANVKTMVDWFANEGTPHDLNNPLNLQTPHGGSTVSTANVSSPGDRIQAYPKCRLLQRGRGSGRAVPVRLAGGGGGDAG